MLGKGPVYKEKREKDDAALLELNNLKKINRDKIASNETSIAQLQIDQKNLMKSMVDICLSLKKKTPLPTYQNMIK